MSAKRAHARLLTRVLEKRRTVGALSLTPMRALNGKNAKKLNALLRAQENATRRIVSREKLNRAANPKKKLADAFHKSQVRLRPHRVKRRRLDASRNRLSPPSSAVPFEALADLLNQRRLARPLHAAAR